MFALMNKSHQTSFKDVNFCLRCGHKLSLRPDREDKLRPQCPACSWVYYKNPIPATAIVLLNEAGELLLVKRRFEPKAGEWALPSGYLEIFHTPEENALEELREETGLEGEILHSLGWYYGSSPIYDKILSIGFRIKAIGGVLRAGDDALEAMFYPLDQLPPIAFSSHREFIKRDLGIAVK